MNGKIRKQLDDLQQTKTDLMNMINVRGGGLTDSAYFEDYPDAIRATAPVPLTPTIHGVNYYDYKGDLVHVYSVEEFLALTAEPEQPGSDTLNPDGWNWSLADAKEFITNTFDLLNIGGQYVTKDKKTHVYLEIPEWVDGEHLSLNFTFTIHNKVASSVTIDWDDGTTPSVISVAGSNNAYIIKYQTHVYEHPGKYEIIVTPGEGMYYSLGGPSGYTVTMGYSYTSYREASQWVRRVECGERYLYQYSDVAGNCHQCEYVSVPHFIHPDNTHTTIYTTYMFYYANQIQAVIVPSGVTGWSSATVAVNTFQWTNKAKVISLPKSMQGTYTNTTNYAFYPCSLLDSLVLPKGLAINQLYGLASSSQNRRMYIGDSLPTLKNYYLNSDSCLEEVTLPDGITAIGVNSIYSCFCLKKINVPSSVTSIGNNAFAYDYALEEIMCLPGTPPTLGTTPLTYTYFPVITLRPSTISAYVAATGWADWAWRFRKIGVFYDYGPTTKNAYITSAAASYGVGVKGWEHSDYVDISSHAGHSVKTYTGYTSGSYYVAFYDSNKTKLSTISPGSCPTTGTIPAGAVYMRMSIRSHKRHIATLWDETDKVLIYPRETVFNQMWVPSNGGNNYNNKGVKITKNTDGASWTISGKATAAISITNWVWWANEVQYDKYIVRRTLVDKVTLTANVYNGITLNTTTSVQTGGKKNSGQPNGNAYTLSIAEGTDFGDGEQLKINIFDLTEMYGSGNEPTTVEQFDEMIPKDKYYSYTEPHADNYIKITSESSTYSVDDVGYGWDVSDATNNPPSFYLNDTKQTGTWVFDSTNNQATFTIGSTVYTLSPLVLPTTVTVS